MTEPKTTTSPTITVNWASIRSPDLLMSAGVVVVLMIMLLPIPRLILDLLLAFNITLAILILIVGMQIRKPLDFSVFPSVLLIVTLFRLSLNIAATRLILLHGSEGPGAAGDVIRAFGNFVVGGNFAVGIVVFTILVVINFVVVTKGAGRIAEVSARFTLDAMPGKQMAIDADLNAGLMTDTDAKARRREIALEADFYGAMDGSSKFVRGDAIAAVVIILVNILGGLTIGLAQQGMTLAAAAANYTILTIGEGLVAQIPALIISVAAGMVVTRAATEANLGEEIAGQILISHRAIGLTGVVLLGLGLVPGLPHLAFLILGGLVCWIAYALYQQRTKAERTPAPPPPPADPPVAVTTLDLLEVQIGYGLIPLVDKAQPGNLLDRIKTLRRQTANDLGFVVPPIHVRDNLALEPNRYSILLKGIELAKGELLPGHVLAIDPGGLNTTPIAGGIRTKDPTFGLPALWIPDAQRDTAHMAGYTVVDGSAALATHLAEVIKQHAWELLGRQETQALLDGLAKTYPKVVEDLIPNQLSLGALVRVLGNLLRERIPIRDLRSILETLADHAGHQKDPDQLTESVRHALARTITRQGLAPDGVLPILNLDAQLDQQLVERLATTPQGLLWTIDGQTAHALITTIRQAAERVISTYSLTPVILCSAALRPHLRRLTQRLMPSIPVMSINELDGSVKVQSLESIRLTIAPLPSQRSVPGTAGSDPATRSA